MKGNKAFIQFHREPLFGVNAVNENGYSSSLSSRVKWHIYVRLAPNGFSRYRDMR